MHQAVAQDADLAANRASWRSTVEVFKPRIALEIMFAGIAGVAMAQGPGLPPWQLLVLAVAVFLAAASAGALNHLAERDLDARMSRTRGRPFVTGQLEGGWPWFAAIGLLLAVAVVSAGLATNWLAAAFVFLGAFTYGVVYTLWLKRRTWLNIVVGGLAGSFAVLAGAAAVNPGLGPRRMDVCGRPVPMDPAALLEPRDVLPAGLRRRRRADAAGGVWRSRLGSRDPWAHRAARVARAVAGGLGRRELPISPVPQPAARISSTEASSSSAHRHGRTQSATSWPRCCS